MLDLVPIYLAQRNAWLDELSETLADTFAMNVRMRLPRFDPDKSTAMGGDPRIAYYHSLWKLQKHEALVIEVTPPDCEHWNFQLNNYWMESLDYRYFPIHINKHTATYNDDGSVRVIVAHEDPGLPNWLTTTGHAVGTMCWRWIRADEHPTPKVTLVPFSELAQWREDPRP